MPIKLLGDHTCSVDGGIVILGDTPPGKKEMLQHGVKMSTQDHDVTIGINLAF